MEHTLTFLASQRARARMHTAYPARPGECAGCRKRREYCRCRPALDAAAYRQKILGKLKFA